MALFFLVELCHNYILYISDLSHACNNKITTSIVKVFTEIQNRTKGRVAMGCNRAESMSRAAVFHTVCTGVCGWAPFCTASDGTWHINPYGKTLFFNDVTCVT